MTQQVAIDPATVLQHLANLERYIENIRNAINTANERLIETRVAREALKNFKKYEKEELLVSIDRHANTLVKTTVKKYEKPIIHLGIGIYAETDYEEAEKILLEREHLYTRELQELQKELEEKTQEYQRIQGIIYALQQQQ